MGFYRELLSANSAAKEIPVSGMLHKVPAKMPMEEKSIFLRWNNGAQQQLAVLPANMVVEMRKRMEHTQHSTNK